MIQMKTAEQNHKSSYKDYIISIAWFLYVMAGILLYSSWAFSDDSSPNTFNVVLKASRYLVYFILLASFLFFAKLTVKAIVTFIALTVGTVLTMFVSGDRFVFFIVLLIITLYGQSEERILTISFIANLIVLSFTVILSKIGLIEDYVRIEGTRVRHFLGFNWATYASIFFFFLILEFLAVKKGKICFREYVVFMAITIWLFLQTNTRAVFAVSAIVLTFFLVFGRRMVSIKKDGLYKCFLPLPWIIAFVSIILHWKYNPENGSWRALNTLLSGRLSLGKSALNTYPIRFFGQPIEWVGFNMGETLAESYNYVDCSYLQILLKEGLFFLIIILTLLTVCIFYAIKEKKYYLIWLLVFIMLLCITEPWLVSSLAVNPFILCVCALGVKQSNRKMIPFKLQYRENRFVLK